MLYGLEQLSNQSLQVVFVWV